jgi:hypothetical protein
MSPDRIVVEFHPASARLWEATYFGRPFRMPANGCSVIFGQSLAKFT